MQSEIAVCHFQSMSAMILKRKSAAEPGKPITYQKCPAPVFLCQFLLVFLFIRNYNLGNFLPVGTNMRHWTPINKKFPFIFHKLEASLFSTLLLWLLYSHDRSSDVFLSSPASHYRDGQVEAERKRLFSINLLLFRRTLKQLQRNVQKKCMWILSLQINYFF